uniref:Uncharacterized protein n=1 Tax=Tanacetum cinerariifolium TaxID=118510 RepID=A0A699X588_TANCI|nr:hypothetical protein [Tanacetum cinerariifolium]
MRHHYPPRQQARVPPRARLALRRLRTRAGTCHLQSRRGESVRRLRPRCPRGEPAGQASRAGAGGGVLRLCHGGA